MRIIYPFTPFSDALAWANLVKLSKLRATITAKLFDIISHDGDHKLRHWLPPSNNCSVELKQKRKFQAPRCKTKRLMNNFIYSKCTQIIL